MENGKFTQFQLLPHKILNKLQKGKINFYSRKVWQILLQSRDQNAHHQLWEKSK